MVRKQLLLISLAAGLLLMTSMGSAKAWTGTYHLDREWTKIWINQDGSIDLFYNITLTLDSGDNINFITVGQPNGYYAIGQAVDQYNNTLSATDARQGSDYKVQVNLNAALTAGQTVWFTLLTHVDHMIYLDTKNPGNVGMQFNSTWYSALVENVSVSILLPAGVEENMTVTSRDWSNTFMEEGRLTVYWEAANLSPGEHFSVGVSFPKEYVQSYDTQTPGGQGSGGIDFSNFATYGIPIFFFFVIVLTVVIGAARTAKRQYLSPKMSMETLGIRHGLTAVEASYMLDMKPPQIVTEIFYSLLKKRAIWVEGTKPSIKLKTMPDYKSKTGSQEDPLRYYEIDFLDAVKQDGTLDETKLAKTVMNVRENVEERMRGYCRQDTIDYYKSVAAKAWQQVEQAGTPELSSKVYDEQLLWLLLDPNAQARTQTAFHDKVFVPSPTWLWFWYGYQHYNPNPTYRPNVEVPAQSAKPPTIPGSDFANNMAAAVTGTANNIVLNLEKFANSIVPMPASKATEQPVHHNATCACACHTCACACACVSCACACAGGGVG
jgi:hypothetical protein